ncbi:MAG: glycosyltransferase family 39 protein [bacterium]|nr:glycosyltransferase family 39 protein [bacterium]
MSAGRVLVACMAMSLLIRIPLCLGPPETLIPKVVSDDMFYYLCIARHIARGDGATADGENPTNGFHPLWALLLVPVVAIAGGDALRWALILSTALSVLAAWPLYRLLRFSCARAPALLAAVAWLSCPFPVLVALSGVEAPLFTLLLGATACAFLALGRRPDAPPAAWAGLGLLAGATIMARFDGALLALLIAAGALAGSGPRAGRAARSAAFALACSLAVAPWFIWSSWRTGFIFYTSGSAILHQQHVLFRLAHEGASAPRYAAAYLLRSFSNARDALRAISYLCGAPLPAGIAALAGLCAAAAAAAARSPATFRKWLGRARMLWFVPAYGLGAFLLYAGRLWYSQDWYYYSIVFAGCVAAGCLLDLIGGAAAGGRGGAAAGGAWTIAGALVAGVFLWRAAVLWERGLRGWQIDMYRAAAWSAGNLPRDARIGSFNSGILAYYCPQTVINLDGVVNGAAYRAILDGRVFAYAAEQRIGYLVETPNSLRFRSVQARREPLPPLEPLHAEMSYPGAVARANPVVVYRMGREGHGTR